MASTKTVRWRPRVVRTTGSVTEGILSDRAATRAAMLAALVERSFAGAYAARTSGAGRNGTIASAAIAVTLGSAVVLLKALVH